MVSIKRKAFLAIAIVVMAVAASAVAGAGSIDIASFSNPSSGIGGPLFTINFANKTVDGGWDEVGLNLELMGVMHNDIRFEMDQLTFSDDLETTMSGLTDVATDKSMRFEDENGLEIFKIEFKQLWIDLGRTSGLFAGDEYGDDVTFSGPGVDGLSEERFGFVFGKMSNGGEVLEASASFASSAVPEPATMLLLGIGGLLLRKRK